MDPIITPLALLFMGTLGLDYGLFTKDDTPEDAAPTDTGTDAPLEAPAVDPETDPPADDPETNPETDTPDAFDPSLYTNVVNGTNGDDSLCRW